MTAPLFYRSCLLQLLIVSFCTLSCTSLSPQTPGVLFSPVISAGLNAPIDVVNAGDGTGRLFVVERAGTVKVVSGGSLLPGNFLDITALTRTDGERGLLSLAFHPAYATNGFFFIYYVNVNGDITIARYHVNPAQPNVAEPSSGQVLMTINHREFSNHNGGKLNFGVDGFLYFATGDGGSGGDPHFNGQTGIVLLGKMMRINVNNFTTPPYYSIPPDNPFVADPAVDDVIWSLGLRNPFRWSFDRLTHDMWIGDVGQNLWEEVDFRSAGNTGGVNYGWRCVEAGHPYNDSGCSSIASFVPPVFEYAHDAAGGISITGGYVYRGSDYPFLYGKYICVDYGTGNGWLIQPNSNGGWTVAPQTGWPVSIVGFGESETGELYAVDLGNNTLYQVQSSGVLPLKLEAFTVAAAAGKHLLSWTTAAGQSGALFDVQYSSDGSSFKTVGTVQAGNNDRAATYQFSYVPVQGQPAYYRLQMRERSGTQTYSAVVRMDLAEETSVQITPTLIRNKQVSVRLSRSFTLLEVMDGNGRTLRKKVLDGNAGLIYQDMSGLPGGPYLIRISGAKQTVTKKVLVQ